MPDRAAMPADYLDPNTHTRLRVSTYLHGGGSGDAGLHLEVAFGSDYPLMCLRLPGPVAEEWLRDALRGLHEARLRAVEEPWGPDEEAQGA